MNNPLNLKVMAIAMCALGTSQAMAQHKGDKPNVQKQDTLAVAGGGVQKEAASNVLLNASNENEPRFINIGLPSSMTGTTVTEDGALVTYNAFTMPTVRSWRQDGSYSRPESWSLAKSVLKLGDIGVSVATNSRLGGKKFYGAASFKTNNYGLLTGNVFVSGPLAKGWSYAANMHLNYDPTSKRPSYRQFLDETKIFKAILTKRYDKGEVSFKYKFSDIMAEKASFSPYYYHDGKQVTATDNFEIGKNNYLGSTDRYHMIDARTGKTLDDDLMNLTRTRIHNIGIFGKHKFDRTYQLDYFLTYQNAKAGNNTFGFFGITSTDNLKPNQRYVYSDTPNEQVYTGLVQNTCMQAAHNIPINTLQWNAELTQKKNNNELMLGYSGKYFNIDRFAYSSVSYMQEVANNPRHITLQILKDGKWQNARADEYGQMNYNGSMLYYDGSEMKNALYLTDKWKIAKNLTFEGGARLEWHHLDGSWLPQESRTQNWATGETMAIKTDYFNKSFTASLTYNILRNFGLTGEGYYIESTNGIAAFKGANDPLRKKNVIPYFALGVFYNSPLISLVSRVSYIARTNNNMTGDFSNSKGESYKQTFNYDIETLGWTTDAILTPFKGFQMHVLFTLQNPKFKKFEFKLKDGDDLISYNYNGRQVRSTSKVLVELDPSYTYKKMRFWFSARYFSKQPACYPATLFFKERWETFAGIDYKCSPKVNFNLSFVNLLNQTGAQGYISGTNTATDASLYENKPIAGTYIRPFTVEFKTNIRF